MLSQIFIMRMGRGWQITNLYKIYPYYPLNFFSKESNNETKKGGPKTKKGPLPNKLCIIRILFLVYVQIELYGGDLPSFGPLSWKTGPLSYKIGYLSLAGQYRVCK